MEAGAVDDFLRDDECDAGDEDMEAMYELDDQYAERDMQRSASFDGDSEEDGEEEDDEDHIDLTNCTDTEFVNALFSDDVVFSMTTPVPSAVASMSSLLRVPVGAQVRDANIHAEVSDSPVSNRRALDANVEEHQAGAWVGGVNISYNNTIQMAERTNEVSPAFLTQLTTGKAMLPYTPRAILSRSVATRDQFIADGYRHDRQCPLCQFTATPDPVYEQAHPLVMSIISDYYTNRFKNVNAFLERTMKSWNGFMERHLPVGQTLTSVSLTITDTRMHFISKCLNSPAQRMHKQTETLEAFEHEITPHVLQQEVTGGELTGRLLVNSDNARVLLSLWKEKARCISLTTTLDMQEQLIGEARNRGTLKSKDARTAVQASVFTKYSEHFFTTDATMCNAI